MKINKYINKSFLTNIKLKHFQQELSSSFNFLEIIITDGLWRKYSQATKQSSQDISQILSVLGNGFGFYIRGCYAFVK